MYLVLRYIYMRPSVAVGKRGQTPGVNYDPYGVAIDENTSRFYVANLFSRRVSIFSEIGTFINTFGHKDMGEPHVIAIHRDDMYVTDTEAHAVLKFKTETDKYLVAKLGNPKLSVSAKGDVFIAILTTTESKS